MGLFSNLCLLFFVLISISSTNACDRCLHQSKASFFSKASSLSSGACGYGSSATSFYGSHLAAAQSLLKLGVANVEYRRYACAPSYYLVVNAVPSIQSLSGRARHPDAMSIRGRPSDTSRPGPSVLCLASWPSVLGLASRRVVYPTPSIQSSNLVQSIKWPMPVFL
nr:expansin-like A1 [Tanacetum cinerariifolium]